MDRRVALCAVVALFILSGCLGAAEPGAVTGSNGHVDPTNHWQADAIAVSYDAPASDDREYGPLVDEALAFWSEHSEQYAGFAIELVAADAGEVGDVHVTFVEEVGDCGAHAGDDLAGCAPVLESPLQIEPPVEVQVSSTLTDDSTVRVLKHELGHTLGLTHDDEPREIMRANLDLEERVEATMKTDQPSPWATDVLAVYTGFDRLDHAERQEADRQVDAALAYLGDDGAIGDDVSFVRTDERASAHVVVEYVHTDECLEGTGSCGVVHGEDVDGDGDLDVHTGADVRLVGVESEAVGWHVGRWIARGSGLDHEEAFPEPLRRATSHEERRSAWWT